MRKNLILITFVNLFGRKGNDLGTSGDPEKARDASLIFFIGTWNFI